VPSGQRYGGSRSKIMTGGGDEMVEKVWRAGWCLQGET